DRHLCSAPEVAGETAAAEVFIICPAPVRSVQAGFDILICDLPKRFHAVFAFFIFAGATAVQRGGAGIDQVDKSVCGKAVRADARYPFARIGAPVGSDIMKTRRTVCNERTEHHSNAV